MNKPHFIIAGERRSGSTSLYEVIKQHPDIEMLSVSDFDFFITPQLFSKVPVTDELIQPWNTEETQEKLKQHFSELQGITGQKDADLLWWKPAHKRMYELLPQVKLLFVLRNPIDRAESQFFNEVSKGRETLSFEEALERKPDHLSQWEQLHLVYKERGCYADSLQHLLQIFPKEQVKVLILEELQEYWEKEMKAIFEFLGVRSDLKQIPRSIKTNQESHKVFKEYARQGFLRYFFNLWHRVSEGLIVRTTTSKSNRERYRKVWQGWYQKSKRSEFIMDSTTKENLKAYYAPHIASLEKLLDKKITHW